MAVAANIDKIREKLNFFIKYPDKVDSDELNNFLREITALSKNKPKDEEEKILEIRDRVDKMLHDLHSKDKDLEQMKSKYAKY